MPFKMREVGSNKEQAHELAVRSKDSPMTVIENQPDKGQIGSISFGVSWSHKTASGADSGTVTATLSSSNPYLNDYKKLKPGQRIFLEEVSGGLSKRQSMSAFEYLRPIPR